MRIGRRHFLMAGVCALAAPTAAFAAPQTDEQKSAAKLSNADPALAPELLLPEKDLAWWRDAKFGIFVHWGLYAIPGRGEWHMFSDKVPPGEYRRLADQFDPQAYDPDQWAALAKQAGARYMVMTARHHDGFALWDSPSSFQQFDAMHAKAHRDLIRPYVNAVRRAGLKVGLYYSPLDWRFPAYFHPRELPENARLLKMQTYDQVGELMKNYGKIDVLWWDGGWLAHTGTDADAAWFWEPAKLNAMVRKYQPKILINPRSGWIGDFDTEEGHGTISGPIRARPWEKTFALGSAWGYTPDNYAMSWQKVVPFIVNAAVRNGNALINVGPDPQGRIPPAQAETLKGIGQWMGKYGYTIQNTRPGPLQPRDGVFGTTFRKNKVFVHIFSWPEDSLTLSGFPKTVQTAVSVTGGKVVWSQQDGTLTLRVDAGSRGDPLTVIELTCA